MKIHTIGIDLGKTNFHIVGLNERGEVVVRKRFSRWGAGRLALALAPASTHCLAISDVIGDDLSSIGSGPCVPDPYTGAVP